MSKRRHPAALGRLRLGLLGAAAMIGVVAALAVSAGPAFPATQTAKPARLTVGVEVLRFASDGRAVRGVGRVTATLTNQAGQTRTIHTTVGFVAAAGRDCRILNLVLNKLHLSLLGLNVDLAKVVLTITGIPSGHAGGGVLGSLFCALANTHLAADRRAGAARAATAALDRHNRVMRFTTYVKPVATAAQAGATCPVLDLVVGPLHLNLLGLVVDLNQVHLTITATEGGGVLGNLFCSLSHTTTT